MKSLTALLLTLCIARPVFAASDVVTVGTVNATGTTVDVPIYIRDVAGTSLGVDQPSGSKIQSLSIKVTFSPAAAVQSATFNRAGITASLNPTFESKPSTANSRSLLVTFPEASDPIPFTLNASAPGNLVARVSFTLSTSATPGSQIALALDSSLTQLTDSGGTPATKESTANGNLTLVDGAINIPELSVGLSPNSRSIDVGDQGNLTASISSPAPSNTVINLTSSNTSVATVPATVTISQGLTSTTFKVTAVALGTSKITAILGSSNASSNITVVAPQPDCPKPAPPQLSAPSTALAGAAYNVTFAAITNATDYVLEESTSEDFASLTTQILTTTSASFTHAPAGVRYYYRARARNRANTCNVNSNDSAVISVLITETPAPLTSVLAVVGSTPGNFGSFFKTSVQLYNPHDATLSGKFVFHAAGANGSATDPSLAYSLSAGKTLSYDDLLPAMSLSGLGSVDIIADASSPLPIALARVFNDAGAAGTTGLTQQALSLDDALHPGLAGVLLGPSDVTRFRYNIGVRTLDQGAAMNVTVRNQNGDIVKTLTKTYNATYFAQVASAQFLDGYTLANGDTITLEITSGAAFVYGSTTDNTTNDPSVQFATRVE